MLILILIITLLTISGCTPSETVKQSQVISTQVKGNNIDVEKVQAYIESQNTKIAELNEQLISANEIADKVKNEIHDLEKLAEQQSNETNNMKEELEYYKTYVTETTKLLSEEQIQQLIDKEWSYIATVNGVALPPNGILEIKESDFSIVFTEKRVKYSVLAESESIKGRIGKSLDKAVNVQGQKAAVVTEDNITTVKYLFNTNNGKEIKVTIDNDLMEKLNLTTNVISISVFDE